MVNNARKLSDNPRWTISSFLSQTTFIAGIIICWLAGSNIVRGEITEDNTVGTEVNSVDDITEVTGGTKAGTNLFHSFQDFSIATGKAAVFNHGADISHIISRVTGENISTIDGLIKADANLILINPNGINFGANAQLDLGGSFLGTTADSLVFADGTTFTAQDVTVNPLLTVSTPVGLQLGQDSGDIQVQTATGLAVSPNKTFSLVGNGITFNGGTISAPSGRIDLGSVAEGEVSLTDSTVGWQLSYEENIQLGDIQLLGGSFLLNPNSLENPDGGIHLKGENITLERSQIIAQTLSNNLGANITIDAAVSLSLRGANDDSSSGSQIINNTDLEATGNGGEIQILAEQVNISDRSLISSMAFGVGNGGDVNIQTSEFNLTGTGFTEFQQNFQLGALTGTLTPEDLGTGVFVGTVATGIGGNLTIEANSLNLREGAIIFSPVFTDGVGGDIDIIANEIDISGSAIQMGTAGTQESSSAGNINLETANLTIQDGGTIINTTLGNGNGGDINITATELIEIKDSPIEALILSGIYANTFGTGVGGDINISTSRLTMENSFIGSNTGGVLTDGSIISTGGPGGNINISAEDSIEARGIPDNPAFTSGIGTSSYSPADAGDLTISTKRLLITDGADFATATLNSGSGGQLTIEGQESVELSGVITANGMNRGGLLATSGRREFPDLPATGTSGDITISTPLLIVQDGASVDVQSIGVGDAGDLNIDGEQILLSNRASLSASTQSGTGGDIEIVTNNLQLNRSLIDASVLGEGAGGNIKIVARDGVKVIGSGFEFLQNTFFSPTLNSPNFLNSLNFSLVQEGIVAATIGEGQAGTIEIDTRNLEISDGGLVATATAGNGAASSIFLKAEELIKVDSSVVSASTVFNGQGGDIEIDTRRLEVFGGGQVTSSTLGSGNGGNLTINASESVTVAGTSFNNVLVSDIVVGAQPLPIATGNGGDLTINTSKLSISDRGAISIGSIGTGDAGTLTVNADSIMLDRQGVISADTQSGGGGNIRLNRGTIVLQDRSTVSATAATGGNGGNIIIDSDNVAILDNSQIVANAFMGMGGNIQVATQGLFICQECQITASSQLGVDGAVEISTLQPNSQLEVLNIPQQPTQAQETVALACPATAKANTSKLTVTGRGGLPPRPQEPLSSSSVISFDASSSGAKSNQSVTPTLPHPARSWYLDSQGILVLSSKGSINNSLIPTPSCQEITSK